MKSSSTEPQSISLHASFLRRLARQLVADEHDQEDLVQETWAAVAMTNREPQPIHQRAWLGRILRNRAYNLGRNRKHREDRERRLSRAQLDDTQVGRDLGVQERVLAAVKELREPYREAIYMRYYLDLGPTEIAEELEVSLATINSRLLRGRKLLRQCLTDEFGDRRAWLGALIPLCSPTPSTPSAPVIQALNPGTMSLKVKVALVATASALAVFVWSWTIGSGTLTPIEQALKHDSVLTSESSRSEPNPSEYPTNGRLGGSEVVANDEPTEDPSVPDSSTKMRSLGYFEEVDY